MDLSKPLIVPCWDKYFLQICETVKLRSPDPSRQVGSILVSMKNNSVKSQGFNGLKSGIDANLIDWSDRKLVHSIILHSETNCLLLADNYIKENLKMYINYSPCKECIKLLASANVCKVVYREPYKDISEVEKLCGFLGIELVQYQGTLDF